MDYKESKQITDSFIQALQRLQNDASYYYQEKRKVEKIQEELNFVRKEISELRIIRKKYNLLLNFTTVDICPQCDGDGGFYIDMGEAGCEAQECNLCNGAGIIDKTPIETPQK